MIVDALVFAGDGLVAALDEAGIDRAIVCAPRARGHGYDIANERVVALADAHPDRLRACARVDPLAAEARGARLLFLHPWEDAFRVNEPAVDRVVDGAAAVIVATGHPFVAEALQLAELARRHPGTQFVATNGAQINISGLGQEDAFLALEAAPNLAVLTSGVYREDFLEGVVERFGAERLLYASAYPQFDPRLELLRVRWAPKFDEQSQAAILGGNATRLLLGETGPG